jgi:hypothetical protein
VEYLFKNTVSQKPCTIILSEFSLSVQCATEERIISYASILSVRLSKSKVIFKTIIAIDGERPIEITNRFYRADGSFEDRSRQYETFIRVLHFHLKEKSAAQFCTGCSWGNVFVGASGTIIAAFTLSFVLYFLHINFIDLITQSFLLATLFLGFLFTSAWPHLPKKYQPAHIPFQFLP